MTITVRYSSGLIHSFYNLDEKKVKEFKDWMKSYSYPSSVVLEFRYNNKIYFLNRNQVVDLEVEY